MRSSRSHLFLVGIACAAVALPASDARADLGPELEGVGIGFGVAFGLADIGFLAYDIHAIVNGEEPEQDVHIARAILFMPQGLLSSMALVFGQHDGNSRDWTWAALGPAIFGNAMATYGMWSVPTARLPMEQRFGLSFIIGADLALTAGAISSAFRGDRRATPWLAIPELVIGAATAVPCFVQTARDRTHRVEWASLGTWSSLVAVHGAVSTGLWATDDDEHPPESSAAARRRGGPSWMILPAPVGGAPGLMAAGAF